MLGFKSFNIRVVVPTYKPQQDSHLLQIAVWISMTTTHTKFPIIFSCQENKSAAINRNYCIDKCDENDIIIMIDDDISGFTYGWDYKMAETLFNQKIVLVSARLLNPNGSIQNVIGGQHSKKKGLAKVNRCPSSAIAFRNNGLRFDENYVGSGFEDTDFCEEIKRRYPKHDIVINNDVCLIHQNEHKNQLGKNYTKNRLYYNQKWKKHE